MQTILQDLWIDSSVLFVVNAHLTLFTKFPRLLKGYSVLDSMPKRAHSCYNSNSASFLAYNFFVGETNLFFSSLLTEPVVIPLEYSEFVFLCENSNKFWKSLKTFTSKLAAVCFSNKSLFSQRKQTFVS